MKEPETFQEALINLRLAFLGLFKTVLTDIEEARFKRVKRKINKSWLKKIVKEIEEKEKESNNRIRGVFPNDK